MGYCSGWARCGVAMALLVAVSAGAYDLPAEEHPGLLFTSEQIPQLKERIQREPYATWWQTVLARAESVPDAVAEERSKTRYAKSLAFAYLMTDSTAYAERAAELLLDMKFPPRDGDLGQPHNEGEVVAQYAQAYDMLHDYLTTLPDTLEEVRTILAEEAERLYDGIVIQEIKLPFGKSIKIRLHETPDPRQPSVTHLDNWHIRAYGGLGLAALTLADHAADDNGKTPQDWANRAHDLVMRSLIHQIDPVDGGYAEGPFYSRYAADVYFPYLLAVRQLTGVDELADSLLVKMHDWSLNLRLPDGRRPNTDDGHLDDFYGNYLAAVETDGGVHRWDWQNNFDAQGRQRLYVREFSEMDAIALYDDSIAAVEPVRGPTIFMPEAGDAVFRSDWSTAGTYLLLRGEHGRAREQGLGHEHPDETSFILYAHGEMLALDAGYINYDNHHKVFEGRSHNVILVDGEGPPLVTIVGESVDGGNDAYIENHFTRGFADYAEVRAAYGGVQVRRRVMFPDRRYFVVADEVRDDTPHAYEWRLHGHGGGTSGGDYARNDNLTRWTRSTAELIAYLPARQGRTFTESDTIHSFGYLEEPTHTVLRVQEQADNVEFLAVLYPRALPDGPEPTMSTPEAAGGQAVSLESSSGEDVVWIATANADTVAVAATFDTLRSDGRFGFVRWEGEAVAAICVQDGKFLEVGGAPVFAASGQVDVSLELIRETEGLISGFTRGPETGYDLALSGVDSVGVVSFGDSVLAGAMASDGRLDLSLAGEGVLTVTGVVFAGGAKDGSGEGDGGGEVVVGLRGDFDDSGEVDFQDFFMFADGYGTDAQGPNARYDLDADGDVDLDDFFAFSDLFGNRRDQ